ncbi:antibiotic biosynthesis monooxygenase [Pseudomonas sp. PDM14]|uniref:antibiotic biosynthesis monooxygenase n=1 Tax=Pseudomonas sp. PDM14 TaxID=2769288 RepID=UPI0017848169|nr:antibiotic biosynthesis monooxygenase [Pseudomonas sp. PDM14]MBD9482416.1 antibiotic biosynthesis monooxygenase [Pseudomonas sp. PDM14]
MATPASQLWFTQLIEFDVQPAWQKALVDALALRSERLATRHAGLLAASVQASEDGNRVLHYLQWRSRQECEAACASFNQEPFVDLLREHQARGANFSTFQTISSLARGDDSALHCQLPGQ